MTKSPKTIGAIRRTTTTPRGRGVANLVTGTILALVIALLAACGRSTAATPLTNAAPHGLYVTAIRPPSSPLMGTGFDTIDVTSVGLTSGTLGWRVSTQWAPFLSAQSQPTVIGPLLLAPIIALGSSPKSIPTTALVAYDRQTGRKVWSVRDGAFASALSYSGGVVYASSVEPTPSQTYQKVVTALRGSDGHTLWRLVIPTVQGFDDVIEPVNGVLYIVSNQVCFDYCQAAYFFAVRMSDGKLLWNNTITGNLNLSAPTLDHGMLYINVPTDDPRYGASADFNAYHADTGSLAWSFAPHLSPFEYYGAPFIADGTVYTGVTTPLASDPFNTDLWSYSLVALDGQTGERKWQSATNLYPAVVAANAQTLLLGDQMASQPPGKVGVGYLSAIRRSDGKRLWRIPQTEALSDPRFVGNAIVGLVGSGLPGLVGAAIALSVADGHTLWRTPLDANATTSPLTTSVGISLVTLGDVAYATYGAAILYALRISDGAVLWKTTLPTGVTSLTVV